MKCYICETDMRFAGIVYMEFLDCKCEKYICDACGEIIYNPLCRW